MSGISHLLALSCTSSPFQHCVDYRDQALNVIRWCSYSSMLSALTAMSTKEIYRVVNSRFHARGVEALSNYSQPLRMRVFYDAFGSTNNDFQRLERRQVGFQWVIFTFYPRKCQQTLYVSLVRRGCVNPKILRTLDSLTAPRRVPLPRAPPCYH